MKNDLSRRLTKFGVDVITMLSYLPQGVEYYDIRNQLSKSSTSVGANYMESQLASSKDDFINKLHISAKELSESIHWLNTISLRCPDQTDLIDKVDILLDESDQLRRILISCILTAKKNRGGKK